MKHYISENMDSLHGAIAISSRSPNAALMEFVSDYIDCAPEYIEALQCLAEEADIDEYAQPFLNLCCTYFMEPPTILETSQSLYKVLCCAYLAHRLMEEVNDQIMSLSGTALAPMDMSMANIICHSLIGDEFANQLDHLVLLSVETASVDKTALQNPAVRHFLIERKRAGWQTLTEHWPCFNKNLSTDLQVDI